jgi:3-keto-L-gulonate-6-phosphate decarboxylase
MYSIVLTVSSLLSSFTNKVGVADVCYHEEGSYRYCTVMSENGTKWLCFECRPTERQAIMETIIKKESNGRQLVVNGIWKDMVSEESAELEKLKRAVLNVHNGA